MATADRYYPKEQVLNAADVDKYCLFMKHHSFTEISPLSIVLFFSVVN